MLNRRVLRIKVLQALYAQSQDSSAPVAHYERFLKDSIHRIEDVFPYLMALPGAIAHLINTEGDPLAAKFQPKAEDVRYPLRYTDNAVIEWAAKAYEQMPAKRRRLNWHDKKDLLRQAYLDFKKTDAAKPFLDEIEWDFNRQKEFLLVFMKSFVPEQEAMDDVMEENYLQWSADKSLILNQVIKAIEAARPDSPPPHISQTELAEEEDEEFALDLFKKTLAHETELQQLIGNQSHKWDAERIAQVDMLILKMGLAELLYFPSIPVKVTINECLEISKVYSTPKSSSFINGVLDKLRIQLKEEKRIVKLGRGLVE